MLEDQPDLTIDCTPMNVRVEINHNSSPIADELSKICEEHGGEKASVWYVLTQTIRTLLLIGEPEPTKIAHELIATIAALERTWDTAGSDNSDSSDAPSPEFSPIEN